MIKKILLRLVTGLTVFAFIATSFSQMANAAQITGARSLVIGSSAPSASTTYTFTTTFPTASNIKSIAFQACDAPTGTCNMPTSFSALTSTIGSQPTGLGSGGAWTVDATVQGTLRIANASNTGNPSAGSQVFFNTVTNPSTLNSTFYMRITTYSAANWTGSVDNGVVAASTAGLITVTASVDEALTFTLAAATVALGTLSTASTRSGTSTMSASTNAGSGYNISVSGTALAGLTTSSSPIVSGIGTSQFGINLAANATPSVGAAPSGGSGTGGTGYTTADNFKYVSGSNVATASGPSNTTTYTVSYIANIAPTTPPGSYSTQLTYVATANF